MRPFCPGTGGLMAYLFEQQPKESAKAFAAFSVYLSLGPERSTREVGKKLGKSKGLMERLYVVFYLPCLASAKREAEPSLGLQAKGRRRGCDRSTLGPLSPKPSQIHPRFCVPNSNRCLSGVSTTPARIRKNESEHIRNYE